MPVVRLFSAAFIGLDATLVEIEMDLVQKPGPIRIVGLPDAAVKESKDRVLHAVKNSGLPTDALSGTIHLAPAEIKKVGAFYDLPIALGILKSLKKFEAIDLENYLIGGEIGLSGNLRPVCGALSLSLLAKKLSKKGVILPKANAHEASCISGLQIIPIQTLNEAIISMQSGLLPQFDTAIFEFKPRVSGVDMCTIKGQAHAKRALEIAAAGKHSFLMSGPPGTGKTMLAHAFVGLLPPLSFEEAIEVTNIYSLAGNGSEVVQMRPFRAPHHTTSFVGMVGGGANPKPGEISLAHKGVLFLDELPEFSRSTLEALRQPLEDKVVTISRANGKMTFPTDVIFIAAMNPCPCGFLGHPEKPCRDSQSHIDQYKRKISGPLLDRIDMHLTIPPIMYHDMDLPSETSEVIRKRITTAQKSLTGVSSTLNTSCQHLIKEAISNLGISSRGISRIQKIATTIAALDSKNCISEDHLMEAISYRT